MITEHAGHDRLVSHEVSESLFGPSRIYLEVKKIIGKKGKTRNVPDAYLIDLASKKNPTLYVERSKKGQFFTL